MKKLFIISIIGICLSAITAKAQDTIRENPYARANLKFLIIDAPDSTFGYDILMDNRTLIHQPSMPAMPGNKGFSTKADAEKVAQLVIGKIRKGEMPPTVTVEELKGLKVIK